MKKYFFFFIFFVFFLFEQKINCENNLKKVLNYSKNNKIKLGLSSIIFFGISYVLYNKYLKKKNDDNKNDDNLDKGIFLNYENISLTEKKNKNKDEEIVYEITENEKIIGSFSINKELIGYNVINVPNCFEIKSLNLNDRKFTNRNNFQKFTSNILNKIFETYFNILENEKKALRLMYKKEKIVEFAKKVGVDCNFNILEFIKYNQFDKSLFKIDNNKLESDKYIIISKNDLKE